ncbi:scavenger receptor cysteine-rich domain superfamily protein-like isoform X2 [Patiria miniata]|uniref:SRCR domain-containing protein n=1 Tax=Patiria miniata TaxID=46514 RepID=A0A914B1J8_PATMI|nr:scavenger receptor cysteine-rich domain superfamily protein-like isoform X2 [Patiria miniata]
MACVFIVTVSSRGASGQIDYDVRLVGGDNELEGRVEVYIDGVWGTICDDDWDMREASVVCRQLGFEKAVAAIESAKFGWGSGVIALDDMACTGLESNLGECKASNKIANCFHSEDAGVQCGGGTTDPNGEVLDRYKIRLVNGGSPMQGRVEVYDGRWGPVCDSHWDMDDAQVVCRQLGYGDAVNAWKGMDLQGSKWFLGHIVYNVQCLGDENYLQDCQLSETGSCPYDHNAGVTCSGTDPENGKVQLVHGGEESAGHVVIYFEGELGTICDIGWTWVNSDVLCKELGFVGSEEYDGHKDSSFLTNIMKVQLENVNCEGDEQRLVQCSHSGWGNSDCDHSRDVWVRCLQESPDPPLLSPSEIASVLVGSIAVFLLLLCFCVGCLTAKKSSTATQGSATAYSQVPPGETVEAPPTVHYHPTQQSVTIGEAASPSAPPSAPPSSSADEAPPAYDAVMARPTHFPKVPTDSVHGGNQPVALTHPAVYPGPIELTHPPSLMHPSPPPYQPPLSTLP